MYAIRKTTDSIAAGTRIELIESHPASGECTVRLLTMSRKFRDQNPELDANFGVFDTEESNVVKLRERTI